MGHTEWTLPAGQIAIFVSWIMAGHPEFGWWKTGNTPIDSRYFSFLRKICYVLFEENASKKFHINILKYWRVSVDLLFWSSQIKPNYSNPLILLIFCMQKVDASEINASYLMSWKYFKRNIHIFWIQFSTNLQL